MGRALAAAFLRAGHPTTVWNRSAGKADELVARGAVLAATAAEAVAASPLTLVCVLDYDAVHAVIGPAVGALRGRTLVNLASDSPSRARAAALWAAGHGIDYLDGAVMVPVAVVGGPAALVLYSGPQPCTRHTGRHWPAWAARPCTWERIQAGRPATTWRCSTSSGRR